MNDATPSRHPLHIAGRNNSLVPHTVPVLDITPEHIRNRLDPAMRVPWEPFEVFARVVIAEIIEQQEGVKHRDLAVPEDPPEMYARALKRRFALKDLSYLSVLGPGFAHTPMIALQNLRARDSMSSDTIG